MKKYHLFHRFMALSLTLSLIVGSFAIPVFAAENMSKSGSLDLDKLSRDEITQLLKQPTGTQQIFAEEPSVSAPYNAGSTTAEVQQMGIDRLNVLRRIAGLPSVQLDPQKTEIAQHGAVLIAAQGYLDHHPQKPADMDEAFYKKGYESTSSSNIAQAWVTTNPLGFAVDMFMEDSDSSNIDRVGHRRWQLNPNMGKTAFGCAISENKNSFVTEYSFDNSGAGCDYDFISWPASGNFPNDIFLSNYAWSVTVNPEKYAQPQKSDISVKITQESNGKVWNFSNGTNDGYFNVDVAGYGGVDNCIIFRPETTKDYQGLYTVEIDGLKTTSGQATTLSYQVDFFSTSNLSEEQKPVQPEKPEEPQKPEQPQKPEPDDNNILFDNTMYPNTSEQSQQATNSFTFWDVSPNRWYAPVVKAVSKAGLMTGVAKGQFDPNGTLTFSQILVLAAKAHGGNDVSLPNVDGPWYMPYYQYCLDNDIVTASSLPISQLKNKATRLDMVLIMDKAIDPQLTQPVKDVNYIPDVATNAYGADVVYKWYNAGIISGDQFSAFNGSEYLTRAATATILCNLNGLEV